MNTAVRQWMSPSRQKMILKGLFLYLLCPAVCLWALAGPIGDAVRESNPAVFTILLAAAGIVGLNWFVYKAVHRKRPSLLVFACGVFWLLPVLVIGYDALSIYGSLPSTLAVIGGCLVLAFMYLLSFWFASRPSRPAHTFAVTLRIFIGLIAVFMAYQVIRDIECRQVTVDTWIMILILAILLPAAYCRRIAASCRGMTSRRRATGLAEGRIIQMVGETELDRDDDPVTDYHARVLYTVDGTEYETRADISRFTMQWFGRKAFIGREIPVRYNPENPGEAFTKRIDRHFFDEKGNNEEEQPGAEADADLHGFR